METILVYIASIMFKDGSEMYVCLCHGISDKKIMKLTQQHGITDVRGIRQITPLGSMCGKCIRTAKEVIEEAVLATTLKKAS
ncbi:hypothetical protein GCM10027342_51990 [Photobacterium alginatilyticum]